jgi:cysteine desulfurase
LFRARIYLDHNATTPLRPEARRAMLAAMEMCGSASSPHGEGRAVRHVIEEARQAVAKLVDALPENVIFVSGATEANNMALTPHWQSGPIVAPLDRCLVSGVEHVSVLAATRFPEGRFETLPVEANGVVDVAFCACRMAGLDAARERPLVSLMTANNETGVLQPVRAVATEVHKVGGILHSDAAQAAGKIALSIDALGADLLTVSSHKIGGPVGAGALVLAAGTLHLTERLIRGGGQEKGARGGTENLVAIAGFGAAALAALYDLGAEAGRQRTLRDRLEAGLRAGSRGVVVFGEEAERLPNTICFAEPGIPAQTALIALDLAGVAISSGSACSSGKVSASHVLAAMGAGRDLSAGALRISLGRTTSAQEVDAFLSAWGKVRERIWERRRAEVA